MSAMIQLSAHKKNNPINVGVSPVTNININPNGKAESTIVTQATHDGVSMTSTLTQQQEEAPLNDSALKEFCGKLERENEVLKIVINILQSNPLIVNKYIIADDELLNRMLMLLCNAQSVNIDAEDAGEGCISRKVYRKVNSIYVEVDGKTKNLKYDCAEVMKQLRDLHISTKYVW